MSQATEYDELPVRHNEDLINAELSRNLPLDAEPLGLPMWDPHVKAFLLLQAHFSRIDLPISDYVGDQTSVLDQAIRVVQASIDVLAELAYHDSARMMMTLLQCVKSARWPDDAPLSIFSGISTERSNEAEPVTLIDISNALAMPSTTGLDGLLARRIPNINRQQISKNAQTLPSLKLVIDTDPATLHSQFSLDITRINKATSQDYRMYAPRFPKPQSEGFFVVASDVDTHELVALKRVAWPMVSGSSAQGGKASQYAGPSGRGPAHIRSLIRLPPHAKAMTLDVEVVSDGYIGMVWKVGTVNCPPTPKPTEEDYLKTIAVEEVGAPKKG